MNIEPLAECQICKRPFRRMNSLQTACGIRCAAKVAPRARKEAARAIRERREALKPRSKWLQEAQAVVNRYVRLRDAGLPCVSCDRPATWPGQWHASHFRSTAAASAVRFHLWNVHKSCSICNNWKSGNLSEYEPRLRERIGNERVDWLRTQNQRAEYSVEYLRRLKRVFARRANRLQRRL